MIVVSAENGATDALLELATGIVAEPDPTTLDLLWSTGETQAAALLTLHLQAEVLTLSRPTSTRPVSLNLTTPNYPAVLQDVLQAARFA